jgi:purine-binding chemotaxis protein CheW
VVAHADRAVGLIVDSAREFVSVPADAVQPPPEGLAGTSGNYLSGVATIGDRVVLILNVAEVLGRAT